MAAYVDIVKQLMKQYDVTKEAAEHMVQEQGRRTGRKALTDGVEVVDGPAPKGQTVDAVANPRLLNAVNSSKTVDNAPSTSAKQKSDIQKYLGAGGFGATSTVPVTTTKETDVPKTEPATPLFESEDEELNLFETDRPAVEDKEEAKKEEPKDIPRADSEELKALNKQYNRLSNQQDQILEMTAPDVRQGLRDDLKKIREDKESSLMWSRLAEKFISAVTKYAAAKEGLNRGLDMSNAEIERTNWDKLIDRATDRYAESVRELADRFDKEDTAKEKSDTSKERKQLTLEGIRKNIGRIRDRNAAEDRDILRRRQELASRAEESRLDRESRERIQAAKIAESMSKEDKSEVGQFVSRFTDDPKTARELYVAALLSEDAFNSTINRSGVMDKLNPAAVQKYKKEAFFPWSEDKVDTGDFQEGVLQERTPPTVADKEEPKAVRQVQYKGKLYDVDIDGNMTEVK